MTEHFKTPWHVDPLSATVYASDVPKGPARVADMRGWGYLTGKGHGALALSQDEAIDIQRANAAFIVKAVNERAESDKAILELCNNHSFATGHGDTLADIIREIDGQIRDRLNRHVGGAHD